MPNRSPYVRFERNQPQGVIKIVVTDAQPLSPKSVAGLPLFIIAAAPLVGESYAINLGGNRTRLSGRYHCGLDRRAWIWADASD